MIRKILWTVMLLAVLASQWLMLVQGKIVQGGVLVVAAALMVAGLLIGPRLWAHVARLRAKMKDRPVSAASEPGAGSSEQAGPVEETWFVRFLRANQDLHARFGWAYTAVRALGGLFLAGQGLLFSPWPRLGGFVCLAALAGVLVCFKFKLGIKLPEWQWLVILGLGFGGQSMVTESFLAGVLLFAASGLLLGFWGYPRKAEPEFGAIPAHPPKFRWWELLLVLLILGLAVGTRFYQLDQYPRGGLNQEGEAANYYFGQMDRAQYQAHTMDGDMQIPTLTVYQSFYAVAKWGWGVGRLRIPSALWSVLSVLILYFVARRLTSPFTAAIVCILYCASFLQLGLSRIFFPYSILWTATALGFGLLVIALGRKNWFWFLIAGMATGLSFHGYDPGRGFFLIIGAWMVLVWFLQPQNRPTVPQLALFWIGYLVIASPTLFHAASNWENYVSYVRDHAGGGKSLAAHWKNLMAGLPLYAQMFHVKSDMDYSLHLPGAPVLDPMTGALFGVGFFFCLAAIRQPIPQFLMLLFLVGLLPAMLGSNYSHPTVRRTCLTLPAIYLIAGLAWERFLQHPWFATARGRWGKAVIIAAGLAGAGFMLFQTVDTYFGKFTEYPGTRISHEYRTYLASQAAAKHPGFVYCQQGVPRLVSPALYPRKSNTTFTGHQEELLVLNPRGESLLLLEGYMEAAVPFFRRHFPNADIQVYRETNPAYKKLTDFWIATDPYNLPVYLVTVLIPAADTRAFQGLLDVTDPHKPAPAHAFSPEFGGRAGERKVLAGAVLTHEGGTFRFQMRWPGWTLWVDNVPRAWNQPLTLDGGIHYFRVSGSLPKGHGALPLAVMGETGNLVEQGRVISLLPESGMRIFMTEGPRSWDKPVVRTRQEVFPMKRFYDPIYPGIPCSARCEFTVRVPKDGKYQFSTKEFSSSRIEVNGTVVFDSYENPLLPKRESLEVKAGEPLRVKAYYVVDGPMGSRLFWLHYTGPDSGEQQWVPFDWITLE